MVEHGKIDTVECFIPVDEARQWALNCLQLR